MEISLKIDNSTCIKCRKCTRVCPSAIFYQANPENIKDDIITRNEVHCILCGHCVSVCPSSSVIHGDFPESKIHSIDTQALPSPESVMLLCKKRRSNRGFSKKDVPQELLEKILEAAHIAPTASNKQEVKFILITDKEKLQQVVKYTISEYFPIVKLLRNPLFKPILSRIMPGNYKLLPRVERLIKEFNKGNDPILRNATALIFIYTPAENQFGRDDANLAYQNGSLMAESLGVAQFYTGYVCNTNRRDKKNKLTKILGIEGSIHAGMALGMPAFTYPNYTDRKEIEVKKFI